MLDNISTMQDTLSALPDNPSPTAPADIGARIARRVQGLRAAQGLSLEALAARAGVSRSMISLIERNEASPTAVVLEKLATGLGVVLASLFSDADAANPEACAAALSRRAAQMSWRDPHSGYLRRNVSPAHALVAPGFVRSPIQIVDVEFPPGARVAYETAARSAPVQQQVWMLVGTMQVTVGEHIHTLDAGDCIAFALDQPVSYFNPTTQTTRYAVVIATATGAVL